MMDVGEWVSTLEGYMDLIEEELGTWGIAAEVGGWDDACAARIRDYVASMRDVLTQEVIEKDPA